MNIHLISQHNSGIGHFRRMALIAQALSELPGARVFHAVCGVDTAVIPSDKRVQRIVLPALQSRSTEDFTLKGLQGESQEEVEGKRVRRLIRLFEKYPPDLLMTEMFPFSPERLFGTLLPVLRLVKNRWPTCKILCSVRDIPICQKEEVTRKKLELIEHLLRDFYHGLLVHGDENLLALSQIPAFKSLEFPETVYTGYLCAPRIDHFSKSLPNRLLVTIGGGFDGQPVLNAALKTSRYLPGCDFHMVCGPLKSETQRSSLESRAKDLPNVKIDGMIPSLWERFPGYTGIVCRGGYNTVTEALRHGVSCLVIPGPHSYEQQLRASVLAEKGFVNILHGGGLPPETLTRNLKELLSHPPKGKGEINFEGITRTVHYVRELLGC